MAQLLYTTEYLYPLQHALFQNLLDQLPIRLQEQVLRYRRWEDAYGCLFGKHLLRMALRRINSPSDLGGLRYSAENKPYFERGPFFSISHSANRVVCFVSEEAEVGIDIEKIGNICPDEFRDQFAPAEWSVIKGSSDPIETFYWLWTAKESVIKGDGRGLGLALPLVDVTGGESVCIDGRIWGLTRVPYFQGYACHLVVEAGGDASNPGLDPALAVEAFEPYELG